MKRPTDHSTAGNRAARAACLLSLLILLCASLAAAEAPHHLDYLWVEANEGDSSGGHAALRFDRYTFHFLHVHPGIVRLHRYDSEAFDYVYAKLGNRPIHQSRIAVSDDTYRALLDTFTRFLLIQDAQIEERDALRRDVTVIEALLAQTEGRGRDAAALPLPAAGYFLSEVQLTGAGARLPAGASSALAGLREKVGSRYGADFLESRLATLLKELSQSSPAGVAQAPRVSEERYPPLHDSSADRYYHTAMEVVGLGVLRDALPLQRGTYWQSGDDELSLTPGEAEALTRYAERLEDDLVHLVKSRRTDRALPLLVGMARLCALRESLATGRLVLLDFFPADAPAVLPEGEPYYFPELEGELRQVFQRRRAEFFGAGEAGEAVYAGLERAGNLLLEVRRARREHTALRRPPSPSFPARAARLIPLLPSGMTASFLSNSLAAARDAELSYSNLLRSQYAYDLLKRNCVTELFALLNSGMGRLCERERAATCSEEQVREESVQRLGGYVDGSGGFVFIPIVSAAKVSDAYRVTARSDTPSYRQEKMALMKEKEPPLKVFLRESNTITSTIYHPGSDDSYFLFFTDNAGVLRPLFGAFNLMAGVGQTLYGLFSLPVQGSRHVVSGVKGVLFSVPELFFVSLRKGSLDYAKRSGADLQDEQKTEPAR